MSVKMKTLLNWIEIFNRCDSTQSNTVIRNENCWWLALREINVWVFLRMHSLWKSFPSFGFSELQLKLNCYNKTSGNFSTEWHASTTLRKTPAIKKMVISQESSWILLEVELCSHWPSMAHYLPFLEQFLFQLPLFFWRNNDQPNCSHKLVKCIELQTKKVLDLKMQ